ncbi:hypothetical protein BDN71DRAFT_1450432 [Pleurotus eryngii]|uniref:Uncharacterized protein n=1 Tax=Pleurotus eryngii TaxID=5323 RepID=A0A9P5ZUB8_PLEER|nr:hypothetical protein BDN71DRAFT_1450432 [Pleurotus eryngii]
MLHHVALSFLVYGPHARIRLLLFCSTFSSNFVSTFCSTPTRSRNRTMDTINMDPRAAPAVARFEVLGQGFSVYP